MVVIQFRNVFADSLSKFIEALLRKRIVVFPIIGIFYSDRRATVPCRIIVCSATVIIDDMKDDLSIPAIPAARKTLDFFECFGQKSNILGIRDGICVRVTLSLVIRVRVIGDGCGNDLLGSENALGINDRDEDEQNGEQSNGGGDDR